MRIPSYKQKDLWTDKIAICIFVIIVVGMGILCIIKFIKKNISKYDMEKAFNDFKEEVNPKKKLSA